MKVLASNATIPIERAMDLLKVWRTRDLDADRLMQRSGISDVLLSSSRARLSQSQFSSFFNSAALVSRDESWGLCPRPIPVGSFALMCRSAATQPTLGAALRTGLHCYHVTSRDFEARLSLIDRKRARVRLTDRISDPECRRQFHATFVFFLYGMMCWIAGRRLPLEGVQFSFPRASASVETAKVYRTNVSYCSELTELHFDAGLLQLANTQDSVSAEDFLRKSPGNLAVAFKDTASTAERVRRHLRRNLGEGSSLENMAAVLQLSVATLRRRLLDEKTSFQRLKDEVRRDVSIEYLVSTNLPLEELAVRTGFVEVSAFHRAFKRWTGCAPGDYRKRSST
jgi:AraC-like DNA-binding protein